MLVTENSDNKDYDKNKKNEDNLPNDVDALPKSAQFLLRLFRKFLPSYIPVAIKLAISIGIMMTFIMTLLGAMMIHKQTQLTRNQMKLQGNTLVQTLANPLGELITLAQPTDKVFIPSTEVVKKKTDPLHKQDLLLTLKVMTTQITLNREILGATIYSADGKVLSNSGINPFNKDSPLELKRKTFLTDRLRNLDWKWEDSPRGYISAITFISPIKLQSTTVGHALVTFNHEILDRSIHSAVKSIIIATLLMILLGIILSYILGRRLTRPLYDLMDASREIGMGNYSYRLPERRHDEIGYLMRSYNTMAQGLYQKAQVEDAFSRHVAPTIAKEIISNIDDDKKNIEYRHVHASIMFVDIVGFTAMSESMSPEGVALLLNNFYTSISKISKLFKGTIDKYMGDCAMVVFGIPEEDENHVYHSIACAVGFQKLIIKHNQLRHERGLFPIHFRIGVNTGDMLAGNMGPDERIQYTVVGDSVNLASRLCTVAPSDSIIITDGTYHLSGLHLKIHATKHERIRIRGIKNPINTYLVQDLLNSNIDLDQHIDNIISELDIKSAKKLVAK